MENHPVSKYTISFGLALAISSVANALLVVAKEKSTVVQAQMRRMTGSHWITHVIIVLVLFVALGLFSASVKSGQGIKIPVDRLMQAIIAGVLLAGLIIVGFYALSD